MALGKGLSFGMGTIRVASFSELNESRCDWSILVKVVESFWDIPPTKMHKQMMFNVVLADCQGFIALAVCHRRDVIRRLYGVLILGFCFLITRFSVQPGPNILNYDLKLMIEPYTKVEFVRDVIRAPDKIFKPLRSLASSAIFAKVLRKWVVRRKVAPYAVWKVGMLLADEKGSRVEVSATHKNLIDKLKDQPREGIVYNFQNFQVLENDDKYRITTTPWKFNFHNHTYIEEADVVISNEAYNLKTIAEIQQGNISDGDLIDVIGFLQAFGRLQDQRREFDIIKRLNFSIADANESIINITLWGDCAEETYGKKHEDMEPPITVLVRFARLNRNTDYGHLSNAFNATLVTLNPDIPEAAFLKERIPLCDISKLERECDIVTKVTIQKCETLYGWVYDACPCDKKPEYQSNGSLRCTKCDKDVLMTVPKYKVHYKVYDDTGKCSVIFFYRHATELLGQSASKIKEDMQKEGRNTTIPKELDEIAGKVVIVKLRIKSHNIKHRTSSIGVTQFCAENHLLENFKYSDQEESTASRETVRTESQDNVIEDDDNTLSQLITPPEANTKRKTLGNDIPVVCEDLGLAELYIPKMSSTKPMKNIKKEK
ncbi:hypothetical protein K1719_027731 [Acacia pycnantha]|nr:hypothetical protein K1719_027731 [Acacia pycnantha]